MTNNPSPTCVRCCENTVPPERSEYVYLGIELPCDVRIPPNTLISAGCTLGTLLSALELEGRPRKFAAKAIAAMPQQPVHADEVERVIRDLAKQLYAHHVIKYDPEAEERCIKAAIAAISNRTGVERLDTVMLGRFVAQYEEGADGFFIDADEAQEVAQQIKAALALSSRIMDEVHADLSIPTEVACKVYAAIKRAALDTEKEK